MMASSLRMNISFFFIFALTVFPIAHSLPFIVLHGFSQQCSDNKIQHFTQLLSNFSGIEGSCIEVGDGIWDSWFMPLEKQAEIVCEKVKGMEELRMGYNIVGLSQGNLIARAVVEFCDGGPQVNNFISLGGPQAGTASVPFCEDSSLCAIVDELIKSEVYSHFVQEHLAPASYLKLPKNIPAYLDNCRFLPKLNNELPSERNPIYKQRFTSLNKLVLIMFDNDTVLIPKETSWFGYFPNGEFEPVLAPQQTQLYTEDWFGLKTLDDAGKVEFLRVSGEHIRISDSDMQLHVVPYLQSKTSPKASTVAPISPFKIHF